MGSQPQPAPEPFRPAPDSLFECRRDEIFTSKAGRRQACYAGVARMERSAMRGWASRSKLSSRIALRFMRATVEGSIDPGGRMPGDQDAAQQTDGEIEHKSQ